MSTWSGWVYVAFVTDSPATATTTPWPRLNGLYKTELIRPRGPWRTADAVVYATAEWVDLCNHRRLYEYFGYMPPAEPERHQNCTDLGVPFCVYEDGEPLVDGYRPHLAAVFAALPADVDLGDLTFRQGADVRPNELAPPVRDRLASWTPAPGVPPVKLNTEGYDAARFWSALAATGVAA